MFKKVLLLFLLPLSFALNAQNLYFMPKDQEIALKELIKVINSTQSNLNIAIYSFTNREIAKAIRDVAKRGVKVRIIYDKSSNSDPNKSTIGYLAKLKNIQTCLLEGKPSSNNKYKGLMHMKMAISDNKALVIGSANWSKSAFETNYETLFISKDKALIRKSQQIFEEMFKECKKY
ncbi:phospholipase D-like domain-containing protein [Helicobacter mesocricetorum]|uniref:phospholipase D-like domain-containing protein n=1 Tax=Helicobacter mesocricetorum TaxID=87012 RepID=UPI000CF0925E|nr:phospholipase D-like domain-containing protein [Helicobacter mesocricetorum]